LLYGDVLAANGGETTENLDEGGADDIENSIQAEVAGMQEQSTVQLFTPVRIDMQCGKQVSNRRYVVELTRPKSFS
jgi:hypothetical protein